MSGRIVTLGEIMLRLKPPGFERYFQSPSFEVTFGGGEANTAVSLAQFGLDAAFVSALPANPIGDACIRFLRSFGVDTSLIQRSGKRMGIYFVEGGAMQRPTQVIYDRTDSAMSLATADSFDWDKIFAGCSFFHVTGITAAISQSGADVALAAVKAAHERNVTVCCDTSYRSKLWQYGKAPSDVMPSIAEYVNVLYANLDDCRLSYGVEVTLEEIKGKIEADQNKLIAEKMFATFPNLQYQIFSHREGLSASHNRWGASLFNGQEIVASKRYDMTHIVDRVGGGDAFAAGIIYGLYHQLNDQETIDFAAAAGCLKHSVPGDVGIATVEEVRQLMSEDVAGRVQR